MDKIIRFSAEDNGLTEKINRIGEDLRKAFSNLDMSHILAEADQKFDKVSDKLRYINEQIQTIANAKNADFEERVTRVDEGGGNEYYKKTQRTKIGTEQGEYNKGIAELVDVFHKFLEEVKKKYPNNQNPDNNQNFNSMLHDILRGNYSNAVHRVGGHGYNAIVEGITKNMAEWGAALGGTIAAGIAVNLALFKKGNDDLRSEYNFKRIYNGDPTGGVDPGDSNDLTDLNVKRKEARELALRTSLSRHSTDNIEQETVNRYKFMRGLPLNEQDISGFDRYFRNGVDGRTDRSDNAGNSIKIITEILDRAEKQGLLGLSKKDFSMLPEKINQVQNLLATQYSNGETVDSNLAVNLITAGQKIGGRFDDDRASSVFDALGEGIKNPSSSGSKAFMFESLRAKNPNASYTDILAKMENGLTQDNLQAILPSLASLPDGEQKRLLIKGLFPQLKQQDANRLAGGGNLDIILNSIGQSTISDADSKKQVDTVEKRDQQLILEVDKIATKFSNTIDRLGNTISKLDNEIMKDPFKMSNVSDWDPMRRHNKVIDSTK